MTSVGDLPARVRDIPSPLTGMPHHCVPLGASRCFEEPTPFSVCSAFSWAASATPPLPRPAWSSRCQSPEGRGESSLPWPSQGVPVGHSSLRRTQQNLAVRPGRVHLNHPLPFSEAQPLLIQSKVVAAVQGTWTRFSPADRDPWQRCFQVGPCWCPLLHCTAKDWCLPRTPSPWPRPPVAALLALVPSVC